MTQAKDIQREFDEWLGSNHSADDPTVNSNDFADIPGCETHPSVLDTRQFLEIIHGANAPIYFNVGDKTWHNKPQTYDTAQKKLQWLNQQGKGIAYIVNQGGTCDAEISRITSSFADWDAGRGADGRYLPLEIAEEEKQEFLIRLNDRLPPCSFLVETRNGFHPYWLLLEEIAREQFIDLQTRIAICLGGDSSVKNPARVMRLPGFLWCKSGYASFPVRVIQFNDFRYSFKEILDLLPPANELTTTKVTLNPRRFSTPSITGVYNTPVHTGGRKPPVASPSLFASVRRHCGGGVQTSSSGWRRSSPIEGA